MVLEQIHDAERRVHATYVNFAKSQGLSYSQLAVLVTLCEKTCHQKDICELWQLNKQTVNTTCNNYVKERLLELVDDSKDRRSKLVQLTEQGHAYAQPIADRLWAIEDRVLSKMTAEELEWFEKTSVRFADLLESEFNNA